MRTMVNKNCIAPSDTSRVIPHLVLDGSQGLTDTYEVQTEYTNLLQALRDCANEVGYGFNIELDIPNKQMIFKILTQNDRTAGNPNQFILGKAYDNVIEQEYTYSVKDESNAVIVRAENVTASYTYGATGFDRKEIFVNSSKRQESLTTAQFINVLITEGKNALEAVVDSFDIETAETDLAVGDVVSIIDKE